MVYEIMTIDLSDEETVVELLDNEITVELED